MRLWNNGPLWITSTLAAKITKLRAAREMLKRTLQWGRKHLQFYLELDVSKQYSREISLGVRERERERKTKRYKEIKSEKEEIADRLGIER